MSTLDLGERLKLEKILVMNGGNVLHFTHRTLQAFVHQHSGADIGTEEYAINGTSKANRLRTFWEIHSDQTVGQVVQELVSEASKSGWPRDTQLIEECSAIAQRLISGGPNLRDLRAMAERFDQRHLQEEIGRLESAAEEDPALAIGTAKELIETCCKTILSQRGIPYHPNAELSELTKATFKALKLTPEDVPETKRGSDSIKRILSNLSSVSNEINQLRNLYGTGHGKEANATGLGPRHSKLVVGSSATLVRFLFESHQEQMEQHDPLPNPIF